MGLKNYPGQTQSQKNIQTRDKKGDDFRPVMPACSRIPVGDGIQDEVRQKNDRQGDKGIRNNFPQRNTDERVSGGGHILILNSLTDLVKIDSLSVEL